MIKHVEGNSEDTAFYNQEVDNIFDSLYKENPKYWGNGLKRNLFNGVGDKILIVRDPKVLVEEELKDKRKKSFNKPIGFFGIQKYRRSANGHLVHALSVGLLPEYRGKGLAKKIVLESIPKVLKDDDPTEILWSCHKTNLPSQKLFKFVSDSGIIKKPFNIQLDD